MDDPLAAAGRLDQRYPGSGAMSLLVFAAYTVEGLHYLAELDAALPPHRAEGYIPAGGSVDLAHARWAIADAITAIDLCAGALGRVHSDYPDRRGQEMDFGLAKRDARLGELPACKQWIDGVQNDPVYIKTWELRGALVHRTARKPIEMSGAGARRSRLHLEADPTSAAIGVEELVPRSRDLALRHVAGFLTQVEVL